ncbi:MAG: hypothetical protein IKZ15_01225 [Clostridia bacterium]|nr:hypothetical protein [Clostridia bacterium]
MTVKIVKKLGKLRNDYTEILYFDQSGNFCEQQDATHFLMREHDGEGNVIGQKWGITEKYMEQ